MTERNPIVQELIDALRPFATLAEVRYPEEGGAPSFIDIMTNDGEQDELELRSFTAVSSHVETLSGDDFRKALLALTKAGARP